MRTKRWICFLLCLVLCGALLAVTVASAHADTSGQCGDNLYWSFDENTGTLTITGSGDMWDQAYGDWYIWDSLDDWRNKIKAVSFSNGMTSIGACAFDSAEALSSVTIPDSVTTIGARAFCDCYGLTSLTIGKNVTEIGDWAFSGCISLKSVTIPSKVVRVGRGAFSNCTGLTSIEVKGAETFLDELAFYDCECLETVTIPCSIYYDFTALECCWSIREVHFTKGTGTMNDLSSMLDLSYGTEAEIVDDYSLSVVIDEGVRNISSSVFKGLFGLYSITIPESLEEVGEDAFDGCTGLQNVYYAGTKAQRAGISIEEGNEPLEDATWHYTVGEATFTCGKYKGHYTDELFAASSTIPNNELAKFAGLLSIGVYHDPDKPSIREIYDAIDISTDNYKDNAIHREKDLRCSIAEKTITVNDEEYLLLMISARGTVTWEEKKSDHYTNADTNFGSYKAYGFIDKFRQSIWAELNTFVQLHPEIKNKKLKMLITGHSLGGAAANLLGAEFNMKVKKGGWYGLTRKEDIFVYTFGAIDSIDRSGEGGTEHSGYENIHNIYNWHDSFGPNGWMVFTASGNKGYGKFGHIDLFFSDRDQGKPFSADNHDMYNTYLWETYYGKIYYSRSNYTVIHCPVDVRVYENDSLVCEIVNEEINYDVTSIPAIVYEAQKAVALLNGHQYRIEITAREAGEMSYEIINTASGKKEKQFVEVQLAPEKEFLTDAGGSIASSDVKLYVLGDNGEPIREVQEDGEEVELTTAKVTFKTQPKNAKVKSGSKAKFAVKVKEKGVSYQWLSMAPEAADWTELPGETKATLTVVGTKENMNWKYCCRVRTAEGGEALSDAATLTVTLQPPTIKTPPKNAKMVSGKKAKFTVKASGPKLTYTWFSRPNAEGEWTAIAGQTKSSLSVVASKANDGSQYYCHIQNADGEVDSAVVTLTVTPQPPKIKTSPKSLTVVSGKKAKFTVKASGPNLTYQWYSRPGEEGEWDAIPGATKATYEVVASMEKNGWQYSCHVENDDGFVDSLAATLTVTPQPPTIKTQPKDAKVKIGGKAKFKVKASGKDVTYQWYYRTSETGEWILMEGQTSANLTVTATEGNIGWQFRCRAWNDDGEAYSNPATLFKK